MCANGDFQNGILREQWGFGGFVVSDCGAVSNIQDAHNYTQEKNSDGNSNDPAVLLTKRGLFGGSHLNLRLGVGSRRVRSAAIDRRITCVGWL